MQRMVSVVGIVRYGDPLQLGSEEVRPMFRQIWMVALVVLAALGSLAVATAEESKEVDGKAKSPPKGLTVELGGDVKMEMILIPAGEFMMGSPDLETNVLIGEKPQHRVRITKPFYLGKYKVTQEQWESVMGSNTSYSYTYSKGPKNPVEAGWDDCQLFLSRLNAKVGRGKFQLPLRQQNSWVNFGSGSSPSV